MKLLDQTGPVFRQRILVKTAFRPSIYAAAFQKIPKGQKSIVEVL